jgi:hypothetical protein
MIHTCAAAAAAAASAAAAAAAALHMQYYQTAEDLGLYGSDPTITTTKDVYVATGALLSQNEDDTLAKYQRYVPAS